ncbi:MAG: peptide ABC transporter substrate-binding protein [Simkaniaceae bacterium]|nr:peptide ABC transporter substrate-binding protein [Candidatus Sacchlamyda saccharinae]
MNKPNYLRISFHGDVRSLDPRIGIDYPSAFATKMLFEGLMRIGQNGKVEPAIAESYELSEDKVTYTFHLRPCRWSSGDPIKAEDFAYAWKKIIDPNGGFGLGVQNFYPVKNVRKILKGDLPVDAVGIRVIDEMTLEVELAHPTPYFLEVTATSSYYPVNQRIDEENPNWANNAETFVSNGPFALNHYHLENEILVKKNPNYWDAANVSLPGIQIAIIKDASTQLSLFEKNQLEWLGKPLSRIPLDAMEHLQNQGKLKFFETLGLYWFFLNTESFPFNNKKMRQAFAYAIDRQSLIEHILKGEETPALGVLPHKISTQDGPYFQDNDLNRAKTLFQEALDEIGMQVEELPPIVFNFNDSSAHMRIAEVLQQQWKEAFGVDIQLEQQEWKFHYDKLQKGNYQIGGMQWQSWLRDPIYIMQTFRDKDNGVNMSRWDNAEYRSLISDAEKEPDLAVRKNLFNKAETILMDEMPVIPVYFTTIAYSKSEKLKDVYISELYEVDFRWAKIEE